MTFSILTLLSMAAALLVSLATGLVFSFALLVMPGLAELKDRDFLIGFRGIDAIIQNNNPLFILIWLGSIVSLAALLVVSIITSETVQLLIVILASILYLVGFQLPTFAINIPLNNMVQGASLETLADEKVSYIRRQFENRWNISNRMRSLTGVVVITLLLLNMLAV